MLGLHSDSRLAWAGLAAASIWPVADLAVANADVRAGLSISAGLWSLSLFAGFAIISMSAGRFGGFARAAAATVLTSALWFSYASFEPALRAVLTILHAPRGAAAIYGLLVVAVAALAWRGAAAPATARFICVVALVALGSTLTFGLAARVLERPRVGAQSVAPLAWPQRAARPNIYHFIFDAMGRPDQIQASLGLNLRDIEPAFAARGFALAPTARARYLTTEDSIGSMLSPGRTPSDRLDIASSDVVRSLRAAGYRYHFYGEVFFFAACSGSEDRCLAAGVPALSEFDIAMLRKTPMYPAFKRRILAATSSRDLPDNLAAIARAPTAGATYTLSYMTPPHPPFIFSARCRADQKDYNDFRAWRRSSIPRYGMAYRCVVAAMLDAVDQIVERDPTAVIIVSGDHGSMFLRDRGVEQAWGPTALAERQPVFLALRVPERCRAQAARIQQLPQLYPALASCLSPGH